MTDMLRDEAMQRRRGSLKSGSSHSTGRSFDVSDGRFVKPDGKEVTWSMFDEHGRAHGRGPDADIVIRCCPAFESSPLKAAGCSIKELDTGMCTFPRP